MPQRTLILTFQEHCELVQVRDHDHRPYLRERAAALLKIADGMAASRVAREGLLKVRHVDTVFNWLNDYGQTRTLRPRPATRRAFSPSSPAPTQRRRTGATASKPHPVGSGA